ELAERGADTRLIQDYLGHRNIRHTVRYTASNADRFTGLWERNNLLEEILQKEMHLHKILTTKEKSHHE
ncbi:tyrosine-type recombinase/integrase, partial [Salmonella enterica subsp. enterica serovar Morehead]|nr:tyrosine-type recombinase/integrase [Salmonella enterica subsp. enterica serovar Morehead]